MPFLRSLLWSLLRSTVRPQFGVERLCVWHVTRMVGIRPEIAVATYTLGWRRRRIRQDWICKPRSAFSRWELVFITSEAPYKIMKVLAVGYWDSWWYWTWNWKRRWHCLVREVITTFGQCSMESTRSWSWLECVDFNNFWTFIKSTNWTLKTCWYSLAVNFTSCFIKSFLKVTKPLPMNF